MEVIESRVYAHPDGRRVGLFTSHVPAGFVLTVVGFTIRGKNGTSGIGRKPFETREEAQAHLAKMIANGVSF